MGEAEEENQVALRDDELEEEVEENDNVVVFYFQPHQTEQEVTCSLMHVLYGILFVVLFVIIVAACSYFGKNDLPKLAQTMTQSKSKENPQKQSGKVSPEEQQQQLKWQELVEEQRQREEQQRKLKRQQTEERLLERTRQRYEEQQHRWEQQQRRKRQQQREWQQYATQRQQWREQQKLNQKEPSFHCLSLGVNRIVSSSRSGISFPDESNANETLMSCLESQLFGEIVEPCTMLLIHSETDDGRAAVSHLINAMTSLLSDCVRNRTGSSAEPGCVDLGYNDTSRVFVDRNGGVESTNCYLIHELHLQTPKIVRDLIELRDSISGSQPQLVLLTVSLPNWHLLRKANALDKLKWSLHVDRKVDPSSFEDDMFRLMTFQLQDSILVVGPGTSK